MLEYVAQGSCWGRSLEVVDRKLDLLAVELSRYGVSVAGVQETRWFGKDMWPAV